MIKPRIVVTGATGKTGSVVRYRVVESGLSRPRDGASGRRP